MLLSTPAGDPPAEHANFTATYTLSLDPVIVHWAGVVLLGLVAGMFALLTANLVQEQASAAAMRGRGDLAWIAVSSLGLLATGAAFFYVDDVSEQYFRITQVAQNAYFPAAEYDEAFDSPPKLVDTPRRNGMPGVAEPWWTTQLSSGNTLILRDRVDRLERKLKKVHGQFFIDVFGRELDADEPGWLVQRAEKAHIRPTHGPRWHRIPIAAKEDLLAGEFENHISISRAERAIRAMGRPPRRPLPTPVARALRCCVWMSRFSHSRACGRRRRVAAASTCAS